MTDVVIAGIGQTIVGEHWELSIRQLARLAVRAAIDDANGLKPEILIVGNSLAPEISHQAHLGALIADFVGLQGIEAFTVEAAGASGGAALRSGFLAVASGQVDVALVVGVEKFTDEVGSSVEAATTTAEDSDWESIHGMTPVSQAALLMRRYIHEFNVPRHAFSKFSVNAHANGALNPNAMYQKAITDEVYNKSGIVSDPINMFDVASIADGAAAVVLTRSECLPKSFPHRQVRIAGSQTSTDTLALHDRSDPLTFNAAKMSVERACLKAHINPIQVDFFELHDAYSIFSALLLEAAGFSKRGSAWELAISGGIEPGGCMPISTFGGLKARGNPGGATGVYQAVEAVSQLRGEAGANQVLDARRGMIQVLGGPASVAITHILEAL